jgi:hypothetical protein
MSFDSNMVAVALKLINKRGQTVTYSRITQGAYDTSTGMASTTTTALTFKALVSDFSRASDGLAFLSGLVLEGDKKVTIPAASLPFAPLPTDRVAIDGLTYSVQSIKQVSAGESPVLYDLRVRL